MAASAEGENLLAELKKKKKKKQISRHDAITVYRSFSESRFLTMVSHGCMPSHKKPQASNSIAYCLAVQSM